MSKALETIGQALSIKSRLLSLRKLEEELKAEPTELEKSDAYNDLVGSYLTTYENTNKMVEEFGNDPKFIQARHNAELQLRGAMAVPLNVAAAGQQQHNKGAGAVAAASVETANLVLENDGVADKDVQDRLGRMMVKNGAMANGLVIPEMSVAKQSRNIVKDFYDITDEAELEAVQVSPSTELQGKLHRVRAEATKLFDEAAAKSNLGPEERLTWALSAALNNTGITGLVEGGDSATAGEALYITQQVMEGLTRRQMVRLENGLAQLPALNRKYEEASAAVLFDFMQQSKADGKAITYSRLMDSVGENEMYRALRTPDGLGVAYQNVKTDIAELNQNYDKLPEVDRFRLFVNAYTDYASHNVDSGSPIRDQYQLTGLERIRVATEQGTLRAKFEGLVAPLEDLWRDFDAQHNEVVATRNGVIDEARINGNISTVAPDGKVLSWKPSRHPMDNERMQRVMANPAVFDLMSDMDKITTTEDGNYAANVGDVDSRALNTYAEAMSLQGEWTRMTVSPATPSTPQAVTMNDFSQEGKVNWSNTLANFTEQMLADESFIESRNGIKRVANDKTLTRIKKFKVGGIPFGEIIARSPELTAALHNANGNPNQIQAVANAALSVHFQAIDDAVVKNAVGADRDVVDRLLTAIPAELRASTKQEMLKGDFTTIYNSIPDLAVEIEMKEEQLLTYLEEQEGVDIGIARVDEKKTRRLTDPARGFTERLFSTYGVELAQTPEAARQMAEIRRLKKIARGSAGILNTYNKKIEKQKEVEALNDTLGLTPPRAWAFIINTDDMAKQLKEIGK